MSQFRQIQAIDRKGGEITYGRACSASRAYVIVRVPIAILGGGKIVEDHTRLTPAEKRFVTENVTPQEHLVAIGEVEPVTIDRSR
jgi:hypothetical protein